MSVNTEITFDYIAIVPGYEAEHLIYIYPEDDFVAAFATRGKITTIFKPFNMEKTKELIRKNTKQTRGLEKRTEI